MLCVFTCGWKQKPNKSQRTGDFETRPIAAPYRKLKISPGR